MMIFGCCVQGDGERFRQRTELDIAAIARQEDVILTLSGDDLGIGAVYNRFIAEARITVGCEALVLVHDDLEIRDVDFRAKVAGAVGDGDVAVVGAIGGSGLSSIDWWNARTVAGRVDETRGFIDFGSPSSDVDVVDGLLLVLSPLAFTNIEFDVLVAPKFIGYDIDYCLQARAAGYRVVVRPFDVFHRTKGGYRDGEKGSRARVSSDLHAKWEPQWLRPLGRTERVVRWIGRQKKRLLRKIRRSDNSAFGENQSESVRGSDREV